MALVQICVALKGYSSAELVFLEIARLDWSLDSTPDLNLISCQQMYWCDLRITRRVGLEGYDLPLSLVSLVGVWARWKECSLSRGLTHYPTG